jgi:hypothetical protein
MLSRLKTLHMRRLDPECLINRSNWRTAAHGYLDADWVVLHPAAQNIPQHMGGSICLESIGVGM